jgi:hypothetical protein
MKKRAGSPGAVPEPVPIESERTLLQHVILSAVASLSVVVLATRYAGVRWLPMRVGLDEATRPADVDEAPRGNRLRVVEA